MINRSPFYFYNGKVLNIVDGDTFDAQLDLGFGLNWVQRIRLYGVNSPEMSTPQGQPAKDFLANLLTAKEIVFYTLKDKKETFGRYLAIVYLGTKETYSTDKSVNKQILEAGHGAAKYISAKDLKEL